MDELYGLKIYFDEQMVDHIWVFPEDRFVEYGPEDEWWARKTGFGHEEVRPKREFFRVGDRLVAHPKFFAEFVAKMEERQQAADQRFIEKTNECLGTPAGVVMVEAVAGGITRQSLMDALDIASKFRSPSYDFFRMPLPLLEPSYDVFELPEDGPKFRFTKYELPKLYEPPLLISCTF